MQMMLTNMNIAFLGGDARQVEVIRKCSEYDANIFLAGYEQFDGSFPGAVKTALVPEVLNELDALILPVAGVGEGYRVESVYCEEALFLTGEHIQEFPEKCVVYTGIANKQLQTMCVEHGRQLVELLERDDVAIYNSIPTVEGTLMMVIRETPVTIHQSHTVILGFGRVGMSLARTFGALGARVAVGARKQEHLARIYELGLQPFHISDLKEHVHECDVLINTIPAQVVTVEIIARLPQDAYIVDLASKPGGTDFRFAQKRGIKADLAPGLPGIVAPKTAGQILANVITQLLAEQVNSGREQ